MYTCIYIYTHKYIYPVTVTMTRDRDCIHSNQDICAYLFRSQRQVVTTDSLTIYSEAAACTGTHISGTFGSESESAEFLTSSLSGLGSGCQPCSGMSASGLGSGSGSATTPPLSEDVLESASPLSLGISFTGSESSLGGGSGLLPSSPEFG